MGIKSEKVQIVAYGLLSHVQSHISKQDYIFMSPNPLIVFTMQHNVGFSLHYIVYKIRSVLQNKALEYKFITR